jgi:hypothetical protein
MFKIDYDYNSHLDIQSSDNPPFQKVSPIYEGMGSIPGIFKEGKKYGFYIGSLLNLFS